jgi:membrane protein YdbS with pleckstrin-like domain
MTSDAPRKAFRSQRDDESVLLDFRRHWWSWVGRVWVPALFLILMVTLSILVSSALLALTFMGLGVVVGGLSMLFFYLEWANDHVIVTDQRIVRINRTILTLRTNISEIPLGSIQEVNADEYTRDPFSRVFHFGRVELRTAGDGGNIILSHIPRPGYVQSLIFRNQEQHKQTMNRDQRDQIRQDIDRIVSGRDSGPQEMPVNNLDAPEKRSLLGKTTFTTSEGEIIHRRHWLRWLKLTFWPMMLMLVSLAGSVGSLAIGLGVVGLALGGFGFLVGVLWFFWSDWDWRHDTYIIGRETVRIVHKRPLWLQNESDQVLINRIDNVVSERGGIFQSVFNFGNVRLSLIGSDAGDAKVLRFVPDPQAVQAEITRRQDAMQRGNREEEERQRREEIAEYLSVYHDTVGPSGGTAPAGYSQGAEPGGSGSGRGMRPPNVPRRRGDSS